jgi:hypothetical protein
LSQVQPSQLEPGLRWPDGTLQDSVQDSYPLSAASHPPETVFTDVKDIDFDSTIKYDASFFDHLNNIVQSEPWIDRDRAMIDVLKSIGIEKGKPYQPSGQLKSALNSAAQDARTFLYAKYDAGFLPFFPPNSHWMFPSYPDLVKVASSSYADLNAYPVDERAVVYSVAFIGIKNLGGGQMYLFSIKGTLARLLVESSVLLAAARTHPSVVLREAAATYRVDTDAIALKVKQEFAAKEKTKKSGKEPTPPTTAKIKKAA